MGSQKEKINLPLRYRVWLILVAAAVVLAIVIGISGHWFSGKISLSAIQQFLGVKTGYCGENDAAFHFYSVGNADCSLICTPETAGLIDVGTYEYADVTRRRLLDQNVEKLDFVVISHPHADHAGGYEWLVEHFPIGHLLVPAYTRSDSTGESTYESLLVLSQRYGVDLIFVRNNTKYTFSGIELTFYYQQNLAADNNNATAVVLAKAGGVSCLYTGDATRKTENYIVDHHYPVKADILKIAHHGSASSSTMPFLRRVAAPYGVISTGYNSYGHPTDVVFDRLDLLGMQVYRTDLTEQICFTVKDGTITPHTKGE